MAGRDKRAQAAMEYLTTYGWAIVAVAVVLVALYALGILNVNTLAPRAQPGSCQVYKQPGLSSTLGGQCSTGVLPQFVSVYVNSQGSKVNLPNSLGNGLLGNNFNPFSVSVWFYVSSDTATQQWGIFFDRGFSGGNSPRNDFDFYLYRDATPSNERVSFEYWTGGSCFCGASYYANLAGSWHQAVMTFDGTTGKIYVDSVLRASQSITTAAAGTGSTTFAIGGAASNGAGNTPDGDIANVQFYNASLPASDVSSLYLEGIGGAPMDLQYLVGWWSLNGNANDYSGNSNSGTTTSVTYTSQWTNGYSAA